MSTLFAERMQAYEAMETGRQLLPMLPVYARLDGRGFAKFTRSMTKPFDQRMSAAMLATTQHLVAMSHAVIGYTQSDEISLLWYNPDYHATMMFDRKLQKLVSVLAAMATAAFHQAIIQQFPDDWAPLLARMPHFDARVIQLPTLDEAANMVLWRSMDATRNAVSMAAQALFPHSSLQGMTSAAMQERMFQDAGVNFNDFPETFKRGRFVRRMAIERGLSEAERNRIPEAKRPPAGQLFCRTQIDVLSVPPFAKVVNRVGFLFAAEPARTETAVQDLPVQEPSA